MPVLEFKNHDRFKKAVAFLLRRGSGVEARDGNQLVVTLAQQEALREAGLVERSQSKNGSSRGQKETN